MDWDLINNNYNNSEMIPSLKLEDLGKDVLSRIAGFIIQTTAMEIVTENIVTISFNCKIKDSSYYIAFWVKSKYYCDHYDRIYLADKSQFEQYYWCHISESTAYYTEPCGWNLMHYRASVGRALDEFLELLPPRIDIVQSLHNGMDITHSATIKCNINPVSIYNAPLPWIMNASWSKEILASRTGVTIKIELTVTRDREYKLTIIVTCPCYRQYTKFILHTKYITNWVLGTLSLDHMSFSISYLESTPFIRGWQLEHACDLINLELAKFLDSIPDTFADEDLPIHLSTNIIVR